MHARAADARRGGAEQLSEGASSGSRAGVDHGREPCPYRILGDIGGAFGMGAVGGGIWHAVKGSKNSPSGARMRGGLEVRACPGLFCAFLAWGRVPPFQHTER